MRTAKHDPILGLRVPPELREKFMEYAQKNDLTASQVARRLIAEWVRKEERKEAVAK